MQAQDVMTTEVTTIAADATVQEAARRMLERRISALPVMDGKNRLIGIVSEGDLVRRAELGTDIERSWWLRAFAEDVVRDYLNTHGGSVSNVMTSPAVSVEPATPLREVARLLEKHRIKRVPVLEAGRLVGILSRADLVRQLAVAPARLTSNPVHDRTVRRHVLKQVQRSGLDPRYVGVVVDQGIVYLWGSVRSAVEQEPLRVAAKRIDGVHHVEDNTSIIPPRLAAAMGPI